MKSFNLSLDIDATLTVDEIWPDGDAPENPTVADVKAVIERCGGTIQDHPGRTGLGPSVRRRVVEKGLDQFDIVAKCGERIELGSYGIRAFKWQPSPQELHTGSRVAQTFRWIYGTGCAEPRLSLAIARVNGS